MTTLGPEIEERASSRKGVDVKVIICSPAELPGMVAANPFPAATVEPSKLHVAFLSATPEAERRASVEPSQLEPGALVKLVERASDRSEPLA